MIEETRIEQTNVVPNNNPNLYVVEPLPAKDGETIDEFRLVPIVAWQINTSLSEPTGNFFSDAFAITIGQASNDDPVIFDQKTKQWSNMNGRGIGEEALLKFLDSEYVHRIAVAQ